MPHVIGKPTMCYTLVKCPGKDFYIFCIGFFIRNSENLLSVLHK